MRFDHPRWPSVLPTSAVVACATLGPLGRRMPAPGTWGSLAGLLATAVFLPRAGAGLVLAMAVGARPALAADAAADSTAYPGTVDYSPRYFLINGAPYDRTSAPAVMAARKPSRSGFSPIQRRSERIACSG